MEKDSISRIFIFNANAADVFKIDGRDLTIDSTEDICKFDGLQVSFIDSSYDLAVRQGLTDSINPAVINADDLRGNDSPLILPIYYRPKRVSIQIV